MTERDRLPAAYDEQLRGDAETPGALAVTRHGPLRLVTLRGGRGFVTYRDLGGADALDLGCTLVNSDSTEYSRPILERSGLIKVSTTTPYTWKK